MQAAFKQRQQELAAKRTSMLKEKEEELALFLEMKRRESERTDLFLNSYEEFDAPLDTKPGTSPIFNISSSMLAPVRKIAADDFLNADNDKNDYDWLLTPPGTPLFPSLEIGSQKSTKGQLDINKTRSNALKSRLANPQSEPAVKNNVSRQPAASPGMNSSTSGTRRPSSSGGPGSRPATPSGRPTLSAVSKPSRPSTPTSRPILPATKPTVATTRSMISSTKPTVSVNSGAVSAAKATVAASNAAVSTSKTAGTSRSSTPLSRANARSSTPTSRPALPPSKSTSRASTPTRRPSTPLSAPSISAPPVKSSYPISKSTSPMSRNIVASKPATSRNPVASNPATSSNPAALNPVTSRNPVPLHGASPIVRSRPWKPSDMPGFSLDTPPNLRTSLPERPLSATRGRPGAPTARSSSVEPATSGRPRRQSCSPSRGRAANGKNHPSGSSMPAVSRGLSKINDSISPVVIGTKMVERVINMRKLAPPKQDDKFSPHGNLSGKSSSPDSSHFGSSLSKKSLDMAIRHMDIRRAIPGNLRPLMTNIPASSMYSVRSGSQRSRTVSVSDSPLATSSNASSEVSVNNNALCLDGSEVEDDIGCERGCRSPASIRGR